MSRGRLLIVGGGQSGLAAARAGRDRGWEPVVLEAGPEPVGSWPAYYESLRLFSPRRYSGFPAYPFPGPPDDYPHRDEVVDYLAGYAAWLGVDIRTSARVASIAADEGGGFTAILADGGSVAGDAVIAASGSFQNPFVPQIPGRHEFAGRVLHVAGYSSPEAFAGRRVLVVGAGNSAIQVAHELAWTARVSLAVRDRVGFAPQVIAGRDLHWWLARNAALEDDRVESAVDQFGGEVVDVRGALRQDETVTSSAVGLDDVGQDLLVAVVVFGQGSVDCSDGAGDREVEVGLDAEPCRVDVEDRLWPVGRGSFEGVGVGVLEGVPDGAELESDQVIQAVAAVGRGGEPEPGAGGNGAYYGLEGGRWDVVAPIDDDQAVGAELVPELVTELVVEVVVGLVVVVGTSGEGLQGGDVDPAGELGASAAELPGFGAEQRLDLVRHGRRGSCGRPEPGWRRRGPR